MQEITPEQRVAALTARHSLGNLRGATLYLVLPALCHSVRKVLTGPQQAELLQHALKYLDRPDKPPSEAPLKPAGREILKNYLLSPYNTLQ